MSLRPAVWLVAFAVVAVDQAAKWWAVNALSDGRRIILVGDFLSLQLAHNSGAALSVLRGNTWIVTIVMVAVTVWLLAHIGRAKGKIGFAIFGLALGGALGNLSDRVFREPGIGRGEVVDMIGYYRWFVGNVADIAIVLAAVLAILTVWRGQNVMTPSRRQLARAAAAAPEDPEA